MSETIREKLNRIDHKCLDENLRFHDLRSLFEATAPRLSPQDKEEIKKVIQNTDDAETIAAVLQAKAMDDKNESLEEELVDAPQEVIDELLEILENHGFILDNTFEENPGKTMIMGDVHIQVINPDSFIEDSDEIDVQDELSKYVTQDLIDEIHELDQESNCPITWNFGINNDGQVTGGLDIMNQWVEESLQERVSPRVKGYFEPAYSERYSVRAYYDDNYRGLADSFSSDDFDEIRDKAHEYLSDGSCITVNDYETGKFFTLTPDEYFYGFEGEGIQPYMFESLNESTFNRYSENKGWWYFSPNDVEPDSLPKGVHVLETRKEESRNGVHGTFMLLDAKLSPSQLVHYGINAIREETPLSTWETPPEGEVNDIYPESLDLLSDEEIKALPYNVRPYQQAWWSRSPNGYINSDHSRVVYVRSNGLIDGYGAEVNTPWGLAVRPALTVSNLDSSDLQLYKQYLLFGQRWIYIGDNKFLYDGKPRYSIFNPLSWEEIHDNEYESSEIKRYVDNWLKELQSSVNKIASKKDESLKEDILSDRTYNNLVNKSKKTYTVGVYSDLKGPGFHYEINTEHGVYTKVPDNEGFIAHWFLQGLPQESEEDMERTANNIINKYNCKEVSLDEYKQIVNESLNEARMKDYKNPKLQKGAKVKITPKAFKEYSNDATIPNKKDFDALKGKVGIVTRYWVDYTPKKEILVGVDFDGVEWTFGLRDLVIVKSVDESLKEDTVKNLNSFSLRESNTKFAYAVRPRKLDLDLYDIVFIDNNKRASSKRFENEKDCFEFIKKNAKKNNWIVDRKEELKNKKDKLTSFGKKILDANNLDEDTIKQNGKWVNKGKEGTHGKFRTKKQADAQRKAMFANGYKGESLNEAYEAPYFKAYITNLGKYNEGELIGDWVEFPIDEDDFTQVLESIGIGDTDAFGAPYEEWFVSDYDCNLPGFDWQELGEYPSYESLQEYGELVNSIDDLEAVSNALEVTGNLQDAIDGIDNGSIMFYRGVNDNSDLGYMWVDEVYGGAENLDKDTLERYFDYEQLGRDLSFDSYENDEGEDISAGEYWCGDENASDYDIGVAFVEDVGIDGVSDISSYFDYEQFGRDLTFDGFTFTSDGCVLQESLKKNGKLLKEDYQHKDDEWGSPYTYKEVERELKDITNDFTDKDGNIRCYWEQEKEYGKQILKDHYDIIEVSDGRTGKGEDMSWVISYANPKIDMEKEYQRGDK